MGKIELLIEHKGGVIRIPFTDLKSADEFTMGYNNKLELFSALNNILNLGISTSSFYNIYLLNSYRGRNKGHKLQYKRLDIKYKTDDYDIDDLKEVYAKYYKDNHARILAYREGIRYVKHDAVRNYNINSDNITDREIDMAVTSYFKDGSYKTYRDAYFRVKNAGYNVKIKKKKFIEEDKTNLAYYDIQDENMEYLKRYGSFGEDENDRAIEELSYYDIDDVKNSISSDKYLLFDYLDNDNRLDNIFNEIDDIISLEALSGMSIEELKKLISKYQKKYANKGPKK